jgi:cytochrome b subunit of formate dehydrogenase
VSPRVRATGARILYWVAVLVVALALVVGLILFFEARDASQVGLISIA